MKICVTSDVHGRYDRYCEIAKQIQQLSPDIVIDNGDFLQGGLTSYYYEFINPKLHPMVDIANAIPLDAAILGNHEFNSHPKLLNQMRSHCRFPWIACNIGDFVKPYIIKQIEGKKVAIIGAVTAATPKWDELGYTKNLSFLSAFECVKKTIEQLKANEQPDFIIVSYHGGFATCPDTGVYFANEDDENEANRLLSLNEVDILITGHQHLLIHTYNQNKLVIQPGSNGECFVEIDVNIHSKEAIATFHPITCNTIYPIEVAQWLKQQIGSTKQPLSFNSLLSSRITNNAIVQLIHEVQLTTTNAELSIVEMGFHERGHLEGEITNEDILSIFSRPNKLVTIAITGDELKQLLEQCAATFAINATGALDFRFNVQPNELQPYMYYFVGGIDYTLDIRQPYGQRVIKLTRHNKPILPHEIFTVALNSYLATGADFAPFLTKKKLYISDSILPEILRQFILNHSPLPMYHNGEFSIRY